MHMSLSLQPKAMGIFNVCASLDLALLYIGHVAQNKSDAVTAFFICNADFPLFSSINSCLNFTVIGSYLL